MISLQFITHQTERYSYFESARMALEGGCKWIQLRMKEAPLEEVEQVALQLKPLCKEHEAILVLDDHVELVKKLEVDGVHLGKKDMPIDQARQILGEAFIIGGTANTFEDVVQHYRAGADYLGIGPRSGRLRFHPFTNERSKYQPSGSSYRRNHQRRYPRYPPHRSQWHRLVRNDSPGGKSGRGNTEDSK